MRKPSSVIQDDG